MSGKCKDCEYWEPPKPNAHRKSADGMGYGLCWEHTSNDIECAGPPLAIVGDSRCDFICKANFGCASFSPRSES